MLAQFLVGFVLPATLVGAAITDLASFTIPNRIQLVLLGAFLAFAFAAPLAPAALGLHVLAGFLGLVTGFTLFSFGFIGGGDAKLFACTALWIGLSDLLSYAIAASLFGGALTLGLLAARKVPLPALFAQQGWIMKLHDEKSGIPYGVALAAGALAILPQAEIFRSVLAG